MRAQAEGRGAVSGAYVHSGGWRRRWPAERAPASGRGRAALCRQPLHCGYPLHRQRLARATCVLALQACNAVPAAYNLAGMDAHPAVIC